MQEIDSVSRYINPLVHQYTITASRLHTEDVTIHPFAYSFDVFIRSNITRHVTASDALSISITTSSIPPIPTLYHTLYNYLPFVTLVLFVLFLIKILNVMPRPLLLPYLQQSLGYRLIQ